MLRELSPSGLPCIGDVRWGSHFCQFYSTKHDLVETLVPYFKAGLENNESCLWITSEPFRAEDARLALKQEFPRLATAEANGQIQIIDYQEWYTRTGKTDADSVLGLWVAHQERALERGFKGLRLTGNTYWLERDDWSGFEDYERRVNETFKHHRIIGLCSYCLERVHAAGVVDVVRNHEFALVRRHNDWEVIESAQLRQAKQELKTLNEKLESQIGERTKALIASQRKMEVVTNAVPVLISYLDKEYIYRYVNDGYVEWFNLQKSKIIGRAAYEILSPNVFASVKGYVDRALAGERVRFEMLLDYPSGERYVDVQYVPDLDERGEVQGVVALVNDISEKHKSEQVRNELLSRVQAAAKSRDQFLATLSHELRTPLNVVMGWVQMLKGEELDQATYKQALETLERNVMIQKELIDDLLDVSRIITGKLAFDLKPISLKAAVDSVVTSMIPKARAKNVRIALATDEALPVMGDELRLSQVVSNLLTNAIKFTPENGRIEISLERVGSEAKLIVKDSGQGIDGDFLPFIFEPLRQEDMGTTREHGGLGLGLAIARYIVEQHGGAISARSEGRGLGAEFTITIPCLKCEAPAATSDDSVRPPANEERFAGIKILVVDDSHDILALLEMWLKRAGAIVETADSAAGA
ncbi:MAG TPA: MEDS domain-containing protein, partial [Bdellovibrionales bacterium]|nr:MEDS domain-containing protein [Bdellovibrionales bacterium]